MGGNQSNTRRVTVDVDSNDPTSVRISTDVLNRLAASGAPLSGASVGDRPAAPLPLPPKGSRFRPSRSDSDVERLEKIYKEKVEYLETLNEHLHKSSKDNFYEAVKEVEEKFLHHTFRPICAEKQEMVLECYKANPGKPLHCSPVVKDFLECVNQTRQKVLTRKG